jgi:hypothetical protein
MRTHLALVSEYLYNLISFHEEARPAWKTAIYCALLNSKSEDFEVSCTIHNEWSLAHQLRANKSSSKKQNLFIDSLNISGCNKENLIINVTFNSNEIVTIMLDESHFGNELWEIENPNKATILLNKDEAELIFELIKSFCIDTVHDNKKHPKFLVLEKLLTCSQAIYKDLKDPKEKAFLETIIGAAIFYLPNRVNEHFSGYISIEAIKSHLNSGKMVKDHMMPRRYSAAKVLNHEYLLINLECDFHNQFASFMYVTSQENKRLVNYDDDSYNNALIRLGIEKLPSQETEKFTNSELFLCINSCKS